MSIPDRFGAFPRPARADVGDAQDDAAAVASHRAAAGIPHGKLVPRELLVTPEIVILSAPRSPAAERFRRLKTLLTHDPQDEPQVIVVTSALPGEGKSLVSINLALAFAAESKGDVLLVDGDIRRPGINRWLKPAPLVGLKEVLAGETELEHGLLEIKSHRIVLLPAGEPPRDPVSLLSGARMAGVMGALRSRFAKIVVDTPPIVPFTDADVVGAHSDGVILVARSGMTPKAMLQQAVAGVTSTRILGIVMNDSTRNLADQHRYYDDAYHKYYDRKAES